MDIRAGKEGVEIFLSHDEARRLGVALFAGIETVSRAEYFIRTGLSRPAMLELRSALLAAAREGASRELVALEPGVEAIENPRRPRPGRDA